MAVDYAKKIWTKSDLKTRKVKLNTGERFECGGRIFPNVKY